MSLHYKSYEEKECRYKGQSGWAIFLLGVQAITAKKVT